MLYSRRLDIASAISFKCLNENHEKRVKYGLSCITANITGPDTKFEKALEIISIFISKFDIFGEWKTIYHVECIDIEPGKIAENL